MSFVVDAVEDLGGAVGDVVESVGGAITDAVDFVVDEVIDPVATTVGNVVQSALDDPLKTIAEIGAAVYAPWAIPLIEGADVAIAGGDLSDVLEATAKAYVTQKVGNYVGDTVGKWAGDAAKGAEYTASTQKLITDAVTGGVRNATIAIVQGQDPLKALVAGGVSAGTAAALGKIPGYAEFAKTNPVAAGAIANGMGAALTGGNVSAAAISGAIAASGMVKDIIKKFDPENGTANAKLDASQTAIVTDILMGTANAAVAGGSPSNVIQAALLKAGSKAMGDMVSGKFVSSTSATTDAYNKVSNVAAGIETNEASQKEVSDNYNNLAAQLQIRIDAQNGLVQTANDAIAAYNANKTQANYDAAIAAKQAADDYVTALNKDYTDTFKPQLDKYSGQLSALQADHNSLVDTYTTAMDKFSGSVDSLVGSLNDATSTVNKAFVEALDPNFDAEAYKRLNGLGADVNAYDHYLYEGKEAGLITNDKDKVIADEASKFKQATGKDLPSYIVNRATTENNAQRDTIVSNYVDNTLIDKKAYDDTRAAAAEKVMAAYEKAGYSQSQINYLIDSGAAGTFVDQIMAEQQSSVQSLRDYAKAVGEAKGTDSAEYKTAYKNALDAMASYGGYGVVKNSDGAFTSTEYGKLDPNTLVPVTKSTSYVDPVTGTLNVEIYGVGGAQKMQPLSSLSDYNALWASGKSANPPSNGQSSIFGDGSGVSAGMFPGLQLVAIDDGSGDAGAKLFDGGNGFAVIAYSDGTGRVINRDTNEVIWVDQNDMKDILQKVPQIPKDTPTEVDISKPPQTYDVAKDTAVNTVNEAIGEGQTKSTVPVVSTPSSVESPNTGGYTWNTINGGQNTGGTTSGGTTGGTSTGGTTPSGMTPEQTNTYNSMTDGQKLILDQLVKQGVDTNSAILQAKNATTTAIDSAATALKEAINAAQSGNVSRFDSIDEAIKALKSSGLTPEQVQKIVDTASNGLSSTFKNALGDAVKGNSDALAAVKSGLESKISDVQKTLEGALGDQTAAFNAKVKDLMDQGNTYQEATSKALADIGVQITDLGADFAAKLKDTSAALSGQVSDLAATTKANYESLTTGQKALADQLAQQGVDLNSAIIQAKNATAEQIAAVSGQVSDLAATTKANYESLTTGQKALADQLAQQGVDLNSAIIQAKNATAEQIAAVSGQVTDLQADLQNKYDSLTTGQKAIADQLTQQGVDLNSAITQAQQQTQEQITGLSKDLQDKYNALTQGQKDLASQLAQQGFDLNAAIGLASKQTAEGFENVYGQMASNQEATQKAIDDAAAATQAKAAQEAEKTRAAAAQNAANQAKLGNINTLMGMLSNASDASGQQVTVKPAEAAKIGYMYDWSSIFANPSQEKMFASPYGSYAAGGVVQSDVADVNEELLKILRG